jgi:DNA damage-binding protein 1
VCGFNAHINVLYLSTRGEHILVGDLMRSMTLLVYKQEDQLEEVARDYQVNWMTSICFLEERLFLGGEGEHNLFTLHLPDKKQEHKELETQGAFHLGELVNRFQHGTLWLQRMLA